MANGSGRSQIPEIDRSSPDGQEKDADQLVTCKNTNDTQDEFLNLKEKIAESEKEKDLNMERFEMERKQYMDRNKYVYLTDILLFQFLIFTLNWKCIQSLFFFCFSYVFCFL